MVHHFRGGVDTYGIFFISGFRLTGRSFNHNTIIIHVHFNLSTELHISNDDFVSLPGIHC